MKNHYYELKMDWDSIFFRVDLREASSPLEVGYRAPDSEEISWGGTQYQTADARHVVYDAARLALLSCERDWFASPDDHRDVNEIVDEILSQSDILIHYIEDEQPE